GEFRPGPQRSLPQPRPVCALHRRPTELKENQMLERRRSPHEFRLSCRIHILEQLATSMPCAALRRMCRDMGHDNEIFNDTIRWMTTGGVIHLEKRDGVNHYVRR